MDPITIAALAAATAGGGYGLFSGRKARKEQEQKLREQQAANDAWYARNYFQDRLNSVEGQNAMRRAKEARNEHSKMLRARQAVSGATPEQVERAEEVGAKAVGKTVAAIAAQGDAIKRDVDARKQQMDAGVRDAQMQIAAAKEQSANNLVGNSVQLAGSALLLGAAGGVDAPTTADTATSLGTSSATAAPATTTTVVDAVPKGMMDARVNGASIPWYEYEPKGMMNARLNP